MSSPLTRTHKNQQISIKAFAFGVLERVLKSKHDNAAFTV